MRLQSEMYKYTDKITDTVEKGQFQRFSHYHNEKIISQRILRVIASGKRKTKLIIDVMKDLQQAHIKMIEKIDNILTLSSNKYFDVTKQNPECNWRAEQMKTQCTLNKKLNLEETTLIRKD